MAITNQYGDREYQKFVESTTVSGQIGIVVLNPDGTPISAGGGGGGGTTQYADGTAVAGNTVGIVNMGSDGSNLYFLSSNSSGELNLNNIGGTISLPTGAATETTLSTIETNTDSLVGLTQTTVGSDTGLDVNIIGGATTITNAIDSNNSTTSTLGAGATFTGTGTDVLNYTSVTILLSTDQDSASNGMQFQFSSDNSNWDESHDFTYDHSEDGSARRFQFPVNARYFRVVYTNGGVAQTHFRVQTILHNNNVLTSIHRIADSIYGDRSATLTKSVISGETSAGGGGFVNVKVAPSGAMEVNANQDTHDSLNANANIQVGDTDVSNSNPVPVSDAGGSLTVDNPGLTELEGAINASSQLDVNIAADAVGLSTETTLSSVDTKLTTTNSKLTDIETNTDSLATITNTTVGADTGLDVNVVNTVDVSISEANDSILIYGFDGTSNQKVKTNSSGQLEVSLDVDNIGLATETTLSSALTKLTDIETNTDSLSSITNTTVGAKTGLDVNIIEGVNVEVDLDAADDSVLIYGNDGTSNQIIATDSSGRTKISLEVDSVGLATEATLSSIETNTDALAGVTKTTVGSDTGLDVNIIAGGGGGGGDQYVDGYTIVSGEKGNVMMGTDGTNLQFLDVNSSGQLNLNNISGTISLPTGAATETTLQSIDTTATSILADTAAIDTSTASIDTKLTTTNSKLTDIETNTDSLVGITNTTIGADTGLDVNVINTIDVSIDQANDSILIYGFDGTSNQKIATDTSGQLKVSLEADNIGLATESTLQSVETDTSSIDTKLTTTNSKLTDIETNTDSLASVTNTTVGAKTGLDVNIIEGVNVEVDLDAADDSVLVYGYDGTANQKIKTNTSGQLEVSLDVDNVGLATETTLASVDSTLTSILADTAAIDTSTQSIDTKLTTTNAKLTDIETNTDILANLTSTTIGADIGLDANIINTVDVAVSEADDSILIYAWDGTSNQKVKSNTSGQLEVSLEVDNIGLATEATLLNVYSDTTSIDTKLTTTNSLLTDIETDTTSIDTKLTTTNSLLTDIETNTDILANLTSTTIGADIGLDANIINTVDVAVDQANDSILIYGWDGTSNQKVKTNTSGQLEVSIDVDNVGLATEATLSNLDATATLIQVDTSSIDTKLTTTNTLLTDIETNTDSLATITNTTVGSDTGLDVNIINTSLPINISRVANIQNSQSTGTGNINVNISPGFMFKINAVYLKFQAVPTANDFTISLFDPANPFYNATLFSVNPGNLGITNVAWVPDGENIILPSQGIDITFTNSATTQYGLTVIYEYIV